MSETPHRYLEFREKVLNANSPSICAAKWIDSTIWLYSGLTTSCHHPPSHKISEKEILKDPSALHNTEHKKNTRRQMQNGERPSECEYCWKIEDISPNNISDRVFQSLSSNFEEIKKFKEDDWKKNINPRTLEIAFDRTCQFACAYCNPSYSSTWVKDIQTHGPYVGLSTDQAQHYESIHSKSDPYFGQDSNPYIEAFWRWWPDLKKSLKQLRITGGEPLMSQHFWRLIETLINDKAQSVNLAINSNLGARQELITKLILSSHKLKHLEIYTSNESYGAEAEYIRDGLNYDQWKENIVTLKREGKVHRIHVMMTINGLCLFSITRLMDQILEWKAEFGKENPTFSLNIVRWPTFQSPLVLPEYLRLKYLENFKTWYKKHETNPLLLEYEASHCRRLIQYLEKAQEPTQGAASRVSLEKDFKRFTLQYDQRRQKNYHNTFNPEVVAWLDSIQV